MGSVAIFCAYSRFTLHIRSLKEATLTREGKTDTLKTFTVDSPIPFLMTDLLELLKDDDTRKGMGKNGPIKGEWEGKLTRFISRLETKIADKTYGFMFNQRMRFKCIIGWQIWLVAC